MKALKPNRIYKPITTQPGSPISYLLLFADVLRTSLFSSLFCTDSLI